MLLLLLLRTLAGLLWLTGPASAPAPSAPVARAFAGRALRLLLLRRALLLSLRTLRTRTTLLLWLLRLSALRLLLSRTLAIAALALAVARLLRLLRPLVLPSGLPACALLEIAHLLVHVPRRLPLVLQAQLVMAAVWAALPSLGIGLLAGGAQDAFRERHREIGAHCTLRPIEESMDESRRRTLLTLIQLAGENSPSACWDDRRAMELLRKEATAGELRELGMDEQLIAHVFAEEHVG